MKQGLVGLVAGFSSLTGPAEPSETNRRNLEKLIKKSSSWKKEILFHHDHIKC